MTAGAASRRYARALVEALGAREALEAAAGDLEAFAQVLREHRELRVLFANPGVQRGEKEAVLARLAASLGLGPVTRTFLRLVLDKGRMGQLELIVWCYRDLMDERLGRVRAQVTSAAPLDEATRARLAERLSAVAGKRVVLESKVDGGLLGGVVARLGDTVYDGSLRAQLGRVREQLLRG